MRTSWNRLVSGTLVVLAVAGAAVALNGCGWFGGGISQTIKEETGVDVNDPKSLLSMIGGGALGNKGQQEALDIIRSVRSAEHKQLGNDDMAAVLKALSNMGNKQAELARQKAEDAYDEYDQAANWAPKNTAGQKSVAAQVEAAMAKAKLAQISAMRQQLETLLQIQVDATTSNAKNQVDSMYSQIRAAYMQAVIQYKQAGGTESDPKKSGQYLQEALRWEKYINQ